MAKLNREQKREIARVVRKALLSWSEGKKPKHTDIGICGNLERLKIPFANSIYTVMGMKNVLEKAKPELFGESSAYPIKHPTKNNRDAYWDHNSLICQQWTLKGKNKDDKEYVNRRKLACKILARSKKTIEVDENGDLTIIFGDTTDCGFYFS